MSDYDSARAWGALVGAILAPFLLGAIVYGIGAWIASRRAEAARRSTRRGFLIAAIVVTIVGLVASAANIARRGGNESDEGRLAGFYRGVENGCSKRCIEGQFPDSQCKAYCGCVIDEIRRRLPRAEALRLASTSSPNPMSDPAAVHLTASAQACLKQHPLTR
jgi:hypothetical protein